jgi:hypothetical protein
MLHNPRKEMVKEGYEDAIVFRTGSPGQRSQTRPFFHGRHLRRGWRRNLQLLRPGKDNGSAMSIEGSDKALRSELRAACENEHRWTEMAPESTADIEWMEQWASVAKLRRLEVE